MSDDRTDGNGMNGNGIDDEGLGRRLRDAVPEPGPGYWESIDGALADIEGDTDRSVVRLMGMTNQPNSPIRRYLPAIVAAAAVVLLGAIALFLRVADDGSTDLATDTTVGTQSTTADTTDTTDGTQSTAADTTDTTDGTQSTAADTTDTTGVPSVGTDISCYLGDETPVGLVVRLEVADDGTVSAATHFAPSGTDEVVITVAEGAVLDDGRTLQMYEVTLGDDAVTTMLWERNDSGLFLAEDVAVRPVDCAQVTTELTAIDAALAAQPNDPLQEARQWGDLTGPDLAIDAGTYCFANDDEEFPSERYISLTVNDEATAGAVTSDGSPATVTGSAIGRFSTPNEMVMTVDRSFGSQPAVTSLEVWRFVPLTGQLIQGPLAFTLDPVDCVEIDQMFTNGRG